MNKTDGYGQGAISEHTMYVQKTAETSLHLLKWDLPIQIFDSDGTERAVPNNEDYRIKLNSQLGRGAQGTVYLCEVFQQGTSFICVDKQIKILKNKPESEKAFISSYKEFEIGSKLNHPGIVQYINFVRIGPQWNKAGDEDDEFHILLEYMPGKSLQNYLQSLPHNRCDEIDFIKKITRQVIKALVFLHAQKIVHQDLKPENILFQADMQTVKLCDFGISSSLDKTRMTRKANQGTPAYMSPETT